MSLTEDILVFPSRSSSSILTKEQKLELVRNFHGTEYTTKRLSESIRNFLNADQVLRNTEDVDSILVNCYDAESEVYKYFFEQSMANIVHENFEDFVTLKDYSVLTGGEIGAGERVWNAINSASQSGKRRAGAIIENHFEWVLKWYGIPNDRDRKNEDGYKVDFTIPSVSHYNSRNFPFSKITHIGAKRSLRERGMEFIAETQRAGKHTINFLFTLDQYGEINPNQLDRFEERNISLVVPAPYIGRNEYSDEVRDRLITVKTMINLITAQLLADGIELVRQEDLFSF